MSFHKILCPTDFSESSFRAVRKAMELALENKAFLCILHVVLTDEATGPINMPQGKRCREFQEMQDQLEQMIADYASPKIRAAAIVREGDVTGEIVHAAKDGNFDLIALATHGATGWREFALGSVADEVVRLAPCPVLTIGSLSRTSQIADVTAKTSFAK